MSSPRSFALGINCLVVTVLVGLGTTGLAQDDRPAPARRKDRAATARDDSRAVPFRSRDALNAYYNQQHAEVDRRWIEDLGRLAARQVGSDAEETYQQLFQLAITRDAYDAAEQAATDYLEGGRGEHPLRPLATFIRTIARAGSDDDARPLDDLERLLRSAPADRALTPDMAITLGEALIQRLVQAGRFEAARDAAALFTSANTGARVRRRFAARAAQLNILGKVAPPIEGTTIDGQTVRLSDYRGKVALVEFWSATSPASAAEIGRLNGLAEMYRDRDFGILGVNMDILREGPGAVEDVRRFLVSRNVTWPSVVNPRGTRDAKLAYGVTDAPVRFLVGRDGKIINFDVSGPPLDRAVAEAVGRDRKEAPDAEPRERR